MRTLAFACIVAGLIVAAAPVAAQIPDEFTNLKVLPEDIGKRELVSIMRGWAGALGVRCKHCHVGESADSLDGYDFATDELETKKVARAMLRMTDTINTELLPATGRSEHLEVRCATCHGGLERPRDLQALLLETAEKEGAAAAVARYRELRETYYGKRAYDFSPGTLSGAAETLAREKGDLPGAIELARLNVELNAETSHVHFLLGQIYAASGDKASAVASIERALELEPENGWYKRGLEQVKAQE